MTKKIKKTLPLQEEIESRAKPKGILLDFSLHKWANLIERDVVLSAKEQPIISVDFSEIEDQFSNIPDDSLQIVGALGYTDGEEIGDFKRRPPLKDLFTDQKLQALFEFLVVAPAEVREAHVNLARQQGAAFPFSQAAAEGPVDRATPAPRPADAPPLWAERKQGWNEGTDEKASPALWIKMHYGNRSLKNWDSMGLTRAQLSKLDPTLCSAYTSWIRPNRHPEDDLGIPKEPRTKSRSAEEALSKRRASNLSAYHKRQARYDLTTVHSR